MASLTAPLTLAEYRAQLVTIPAGECITGVMVFPLNGPPTYRSELPRQKLWLPEFRIGRTPVTVGMWEEFCEATGYPIPWSMKVGGGMVHKDRFVVGVTWNDTQAYLPWAGMTLPTTQQWEFAVNTSLLGSGILEWCQDELDEVTAAQIEAEWEAFLEEHPQDVFMIDYPLNEDDDELRREVEEIMREVEKEYPQNPEQPLVKLLTSR